MTLPEYTTPEALASKDAEKSVNVSGTGRKIDTPLTRAERVRDEWCAEYVVMRERNAKLVAALEEAKKCIAAAYSEPQRIAIFDRLEALAQQSTEKP